MYFVLFFTIIKTVEHFVKTLEINNILIRHNLLFVNGYVQVHFLFGFNRKKNTSLYNLYVVRFAQNLRTGFSVVSYFKNFSM